MCEKDMRHFANKNLSVAVVRCWYSNFRVCGARQNFCMSSLYRNPDLDVRIYDCLLTAIAAVQEEDVRASFLFVSDLDGHHQEWMGSTTTNRHGIAALDFATVSVCDLRNSCTWRDS